MVKNPQKSVPLERAFARFLKTGQPDESIGLGSFTLSENPVLAAGFIESLATTIRCLDPLERFKKYFQSRLTQPTPPDLKNSTKKYPHDPKKSQAYTIWLYQKQLTQYRHDQQSYQTENQKQQFIVQNYSSTLAGYLSASIAALQATFPHTDPHFFFAARPFQIKERDRQGHTYICGASGSGKTTLLETLIYHYLTQNTTTSLILMDPHGDIAEKVARFKPNITNNRLVYIDPYLHKPQSPDLLPTLNPLRVKNKSWDSVENATKNIIEVLQGVMSSEFTGQMRTILENCVVVLLLKGNADLTDLLRFMDDERNEDLLDFADKHCVNQTVKDFFHYDFSKRTYNPTKQSIKTKLQSLFNTTIFLKFLTGENTLDLTELMNQRKLIIFNLSAGKLSNQTSDVMGKFILAKIKEAAFERAFIPESKRVPCHLFIDESQRYITETIESILTETRKYKLFLTFASQAYLQGMSPRLKDIVSTNTRLKFAGKVGYTSRAALMKETGAEENDFKALTIGKFIYYCASDLYPAYTIQAPGFLVGKTAQTYLMDRDEWKTTKSKQLKNYYKDALIGKSKPSPIEFNPKTNTMAGNRSPANPIDL